MVCGGRCEEAALWIEQNCANLQYVRMYVHIYICVTHLLFVHLFFGILKIQVYVCQ